jgi:NRPS condensation-like uncharacterized protein
MRMNKRWYKLENAAKIFPPSANKKDTKVFRFYVELKEYVDPKMLNKALKETLKEFPLFRSTLKKGFFWYYLEKSNLVPVVEEENKMPCEELKDGLLFKVTYYKKRINIEVNHALTDGTGTLSFLQVLIKNYETYKHNVSKDLIVDNVSIIDREVDSYVKYYKKVKLVQKKEDPFAYKIKGKIYPENGLKIIELVMSTKDVLKLSKEKGRTITEYLTAILLKSVSETMSYKDKKKPVVIQVPVNLRNYFPSNTARNFFNVINISYKFDNEDESMENILDSVSKQFKNKLTKEELTKSMNSFANFEKIFLIRLIPIFIKDIVLKCIHHFLAYYKTLSFSNIGIINVPEELEKNINMFGVFTSTDSISSCMCSYKDKLVITFTSHFIDHEIQKNFVRFLTEENIEITVNTNIIGEDDSDEKVF